MIGLGINNKKDFFKQKGLRKLFVRLSLHRLFTIYNSLISRDPIFEHAETKGTRKLLERFKILRN